MDTGKQRTISLNSIQAITASRVFKVDKIKMFWALSLNLSLKIG